MRRTPYAIVEFEICPKKHTILHSVGPTDGKSNRQTLRGGVIEEQQRQKKNRAFFPLPPRPRNIQDLLSPVHFPSAFPIFPIQKIKAHIDLDLPAMGARSRLSGGVCAAGIAIRRSRAPIRSVRGSGGMKKVASSGGMGQVAGSDARARIRGARGGGGVEKVAGSDARAQVCGGRGSGGVGKVTSSDIRDLGVHEGEIDEGEGWIVVRGHRIRRAGLRIDSQGDVYVPES